MADYNPLGYFVEVLDKENVVLGVGYGFVNPKTSLLEVEGYIKRSGWAYRVRVIGQRMSAMSPMAVKAQEFFKLKALPNVYRSYQALPYLPRNVSRNTYDTRPDAGSG